MEAQTLNKDVIYVYSEPVFSEEKIRDMGIYEKIVKEIDWLKLDKKCLETSNQCRESDLRINSFDSLGSKLLKKVQKSMNLKSESQRYNEKCVTERINEINNLFHTIEESQIKFLPIKYQKIFFSKVIHSVESEEDLKKYIDSLPLIYNSIIKEMKAEMQKVEFLTIEELNSLANENKIQIVNSRRFSAGQVFIKHPFVPNTYMDVEESENTLFHIKMQCLSRIMQCLGASHISGHAYVSETKKREIDVNGKISYKIVDVEGTVNKTKDEKYESDYSLEDTFAGDFSNESYEEALSEAKRVGLYDDFDVKNLLEQRNPEKQNKMLGRKVKIELNRELNENLDSAFGLQAAGFSMNGSYKDILETERKVMFELQIEF